MNEMAQGSHIRLAFDAKGTTPSRSMPLQDLPIKSEPRSLEPAKTLPGRHVPSSVGIGEIL